MQLAEPSLGWMRLRWARETSGKYPTAESFAQAVRESGHAYRAHERDPDGQSKHIAIDYDKAVAWADLLDVRWQWLLRGQGLPWRDEAPVFSPEAASVAELVDNLPEDQRKAKAEAIKALLTGT